MLNRIKKGFKKAISSKPISYTKKSSSKKMVKRAPIATKKFNQYGDKGYRPSNGRGVGH